jgi:predicted O-methyltransferase YrrM
MIATQSRTLDVLLARWKVALSESPIACKHAHRNDLPVLFRDLGFTRGAEIGVWRGAYSAMLCQANADLHLLCVDPWVSYPAWQDTKNTLTGAEAEAFMAESYRDACHRLAPLNCTIIRKFSAKAAEDVPDGSLDFVYIDANHVAEAVTEDLTVWTPKVKSGGIVSGHDYRVFEHKPFVQVVPAVNDFTRARGIDPWFITSGDRTPSFLWVVR